MEKQHHIETLGDCCVSQTSSAGTYMAVAASDKTSSGHYHSRCRENVSMHLCRIAIVFSGGQLPQFPVVARALETA